VRHEARERYYKLDEAPEGGPGEIERRAASLVESQTDQALEALLVAKDAAVRAALSAAKIK